jgi:hypothetical protein
MKAYDAESTIDLAPSFNQFASGLKSRAEGAG